LVLQQALHLFDEISPPYLGGNSGFCLSINVSHNFANSSHYDSVDYGPSIVLWVMDDVASLRCDQYLVFNNIEQTIDNETTKKGVMIKLSDGMVMSFQGSTLRHGTTIRRDSATGRIGSPGNVYGIHFGLSMPTLTSLRHLRINQYIRNMFIIPEMVIENVKDRSDDIEIKLPSHHGVRIKKNQIQFPKQTKQHNDDVARTISNNVCIQDEFETTMEMEYQYHTQVTSESTRVVNIQVNKEAKDKTKEFHIVKYEQIIPNWMVFFMKIRNHNCIVNKY